ncbi:MAG: hypothetical protein JXR83_08470 [Deltaproteobacteria bacterium]|nr:hypothetical protein [Deltaproteobacteria bacterium]
MKVISSWLGRRSLRGVLALVAALALLGCCCPTLPLLIVRAGEPAEGAAPVALIAGHAVLR